MSFTHTTLAFFIGALLPVQVGVNVELARHINSPVLAALVSFRGAELVIMALKEAFLCWTRERKPKRAWKRYAYKPLFYLVAGARFELTTFGL